MGFYSRFSLSKDGKTVGFGNQEPGNGSVVALRGDILAVKIAGHSYWSGNYMPRSYAPAEYIVFRMYEQKWVDGQLEGKLDIIVRFPVKTRKKKE